MSSRVKRIYRFFWEGGSLGRYLPWWGRASTWYGNDRHKAGMAVVESNHRTRCSPGRRAPRSTTLRIYAKNKTMIMNCFDSNTHPIMLITEACDAEDAQPNDAILAREVDDLHR